MHVKRKYGLRTRTLCACFAGFAVVVVCCVIGVAIGFRSGNVSESRTSSIESNAKAGQLASGESTSGTGSQTLYRDAGGTEAESAVPVPSAFVATQGNSIASEAAERLLGIDMKGVGITISDKNDSNWGEPLVVMTKPGEWEVELSRLDDGFRAFIRLTPEEAPANLRKENAISPELAARTMAALLSALQLELEVRPEKLTYRDSQDVEKGDLRGARWDFSCTFEHDGTPVHETGVKVCVSAYSGAVHSAFLAPLRGPFRPSTKVIKGEEGKSAAVAFWRNELHLGEPSGKILPKLCYAYPNDFFTKDPSQEITRNKEARLCWVNYFDTSPAYGYLLIIYVDAATGEVVGGAG